MSLTTNGQESGCQRSKTAGVTVKNGRNGRAKPTLQRPSKVHEQGGCCYASSGRTYAHATYLTLSDMLGAQFLPNKAGSFTRNKDIQPRLPRLLELIDHFDQTDHPITLIQTNHLIIRVHQSI